MATGQEDYFLFQEFQKWKNQRERSQQPANQDGKLANLFAGFTL